jgi:very-short-patch-repair endonuclease
MPSELPPACRDAAALQRGVISREQAILAGLSPDTIDWLLRSGRWQRLQRGAYAVFTGEPSREAMLWAMVHRAGPGAVLSHQTAAELFQLADDPSTLVHLTIPAGRQAHSIPGTVVHRSRRLELTRHPVLLPPRTRIEETVLDLVEQADTFERAFDWASRACQRRLTTTDHLRFALSMRRKVRWRPELCQALADVADGVQSPLEHRYLNDVERAHGLEVVRDRRKHYLDNLYEAYRVCVELDGRIAHPDDKRWKDHQRDNAAAAEGLVTLRFNWNDVTRRPCRAAWLVARALQQGGWLGAPRRCGHGCPVPPPVP